MPRRCSVFGCRSNYDKEKEYVTTFAIPRNEPLRSRWLSKIPTELGHLKSPSICLKHFPESSVVKVDKVIVNGEWKEYPRKIPKLKDDAVPTLFENVPAYLSTKTCVSRRLIDVEEEHFELAVKESLEEKKKYNEKNIITSLTQITDYLNKDNSHSKWTYLHHNKKVMMCLVSIENNYPEITACIIVAQSLDFEVLINKVRVNNCKLPHKATKINSFNLLNSVMEYVEANYMKPQDYDCISTVIQLLKSSEKYEDSKQLQFLVEQLCLFVMPKNNKRYCNLSMVVAASMYTHSPSAYSALRNFGVLCLPHHRNLQKLVACMSLSNYDLHGSINYIKSQTTYLKDHEFLVNLILDEVYIEPRLSFKGSSVYGCSYENGNNVAKTTQVFMITSILSNYKDVVSMFPVCYMTAEQLHSMIMSVLTAVEGIGFKVISVIADNNVINRKAFELFSPKRILQPVITHPLNTERKLFFVFDPVHILKCVRNNWIRKNNQRFLNYPDFSDHSKMMCAEFRHLELLYDVEKKSLVKYGHLLNVKSLYPSNIQKQNVNLTLRIINEKNIAALKQIAQDHPFVFSNVEGTCNFLNIFVTWWKIVNVKSASEGQRFNDSFREPIRNKENSSIGFLKQMVLWLKIWRQSYNIADTLTAQTFASIITTTECFVMLQEYMFHHYKIDYLLFGKFQSDDLESRFGMYRRLSGSNYYISFVDVIASERKIRFENLVLLSSKEANVPLKSLISQDDIDPSLSADIGFFSDVIDRSIVNFEHVPQNIKKILVYIGGFSVKRELWKKKCDQCVSWLQLSATVELNNDFDYLQELNRGKLTLPTECVVKAVCIVWNVAKLLVENHLNFFLSAQNQLNIFYKLCCIYLERDNTDSFKEQCQCAETHLDKLEKIMFRCCKIFLNNIVNAHNDLNSVKTNSKAKVRKLNG